MSAELRPLTLADVGAVLALEQALFGPSAWSQETVRDEVAGYGRWYVGLDGPAAGATGPAGAPGSPSLVGYAGARFDGDVVEVMTIGVAAGAQRRGLGSQLLGALIAHARSLGASAVLLEVRVDNDPAIALYERAGFSVVGRRRRYYQPEDIDAFTMRTEL